MAPWRRREWEGETTFNGIVAAVVRRGGEIVLVQQQGPEDPEPAWALPGGRVEPGEGLVEALRREVREETGLEIGDPERLVYLSEVEDAGKAPFPEGADRSIVAVFDVPWVPGPILLADPDDFIRAVAFVERREAIARLERHPIRAMREPIVAALRGEAPAGSAWFYRVTDEGETLLGRIPPLPPEPVPAAGTVETDRQKAYIVLGCLFAIGVLVLIIVVGIIAIAHPHL